MQSVVNPILTKSSSGSRTTRTFITHIAAHCRPGQTTIISEPSRVSRGGSSSANRPPAIFGSKRGVPRVGVSNDQPVVAEHGYR
ncbi:hypothetical protein KC350_g49 [Hortaea werneckii]|nr:hypothetical protein KC350_g49 [Hortaea werneckii]